MQAGLDHRRSLNQVQAPTDNSSIAAADAYFVSVSANRNFALGCQKYFIAGWNTCANSHPYSVTKLLHPVPARKGMCVCREAAGKGCHILYPLLKFPDPSNSQATTVLSSHRATCKQRSRFPACLHDMSGSPELAARDVM